MSDDDEFDPWVPLRVYALYAQPPVLDNPFLLEVLRAEFTQVDAVDGAVVVTHPSLLGATEDGDPSWGSTSIAPAPVPSLAAFDAVTGPVDEPRPDLTAVRAALAIDEELPGYVSVDRRRAAFASVVTALSEATGALALAWEPSQAITSVRADGQWGFIGLRRRRADDGWSLETLGLSTFDLPDISCRFSNLDPDQLARIVYRHATAVLEGSEFIADGDPVLEPDGLWLRAVWGWGGDPERHVIALIPEPGQRPGKPSATD